MNAPNIPIPDSTMMVKFSKAMNSILWGGIMYYFMFEMIVKHISSKMTTNEAFMLGVFMLALFLLVFDKVHTYIWTDPKPKAPHTIVNGEDTKGFRTPWEYL
jgi:hydrogenase-4 membrane subunit HyfE